ncbi:hypothetical protein [Flammeovirga yaeyamensis]|nr:hypothetical protein [Flammeovirga yaeyamensis]MBB3700002.1 hypothetical protein [Flammeovirga yaeyamensis]
MTTIKSQRITMNQELKRLFNRQVYDKVVAAAQKHHDDFIKQIAKETELTESTVSLFFSTTVDKIK